MGFVLHFVFYVENKQIICKTWYANGVRNGNGGADFEERNKNENKQGI